uniref:Uncharacterized protein n=1 Tax=Siphoviridae sp. ct47J5 TaxID=2826286 RepID=A0A8S5MK34_9CAUD|nr:MAG TPA: Protein of unknown function (DUF3102) [Siphoviridae sp. ct47J5]
MTTYICKCGQRVQKSSNADNTGNRLEGYGPGHECYGCPYAMPWGGNKWDEAAKRFVQDINGYECRTSRTLSYDSHFIGSTKDKCTCSVVSLDFDFLEQISAWVKDTFPLGEITGNFSRDEIRPTDYSHNGRYCCTFVCASNKKGIAAKAALFARFFNPDGSRKDITPQQEMEKILADIEKAKEDPTCKTAPNADAAATTAESAVPNATAEMQTTSESAADASESVPAASPQSCESGPAASAEASSASLLSTAPQDKPLTFIQQDKCPEFDYSDLPEQTVATLHLAESGYLHGKKLAEKGLVYMGDNIALAHDELCSTVVAQCDNGRFAKKEDTFRAWCLHIGITKDSAYRLLQVSALLADSSPRQRAVLESLPPSLLYAVAKPSAPPELVEKVKNGEVSSNKAYQDLLKENQQLRTDRVNAMNQAEREKARAEKAEAERDKARADQISTAKDCNRLGLKVSQEKDRADKAEAREEEAWKLQSKAETRAQEAEKQLEGSRQVAEAAKLRADKLKAENDALKKQPITAVVDEDEVDRRAGEKAYKIAAGMTAEYKAQQEQDARDAYDSIILAGRSITSIVQSTKLQFRKLPDDQRESAINQLVHTLASAQGEVSACL